MKIIIKPAKIDQVERLSEIEDQCFGKEAYGEQNLSYLLDSPGTVTLVASINYDLAGFIVARVDVSRNVQFGHIITLDVLEPWRRKGVASKLLYQAEEWFKAMDFSEVRLEVGEDNVAALALYTQNGYKVIGELERYYEGTNGLYLQKIIDLANDYKRINFLGKG
jgi:ribosomal protein S18 acetylase RimI-like enzyme